jgi:Domain of unknown function (DUF4105)
MATLKKRFLVAVLSCILFGLWLWCTLAIRFSGLPGEILPFAAAGIFAAGVPLVFIFLPDRKRTAYGVFILCAGIIVAWLQIKPSHDRDWVASVAKLPSVTFEGDQAKVRNIRNFDYKTEKDFSVRYYDKTFDLNKIESIDYILVYWDGNEAVAHTILSFGFSDGEYLSVSVETRLERGEPQSGLRGLFKQYESIYILGDEKDLLRLRTNYRKEDVFLYPTTADPQIVRKMFKAIMERVNQIASEPEFYNTLSHSCFTSLASDFEKIIARRSFFDYRRIANGYSDEILYENGWIDSKLSFEDTKRLHYVNQYVTADVDDVNYSIKIRPHMASE